MPGRGGGDSTALPRQGCICQGCRARRFLPCHDLGQLVVFGHGVPRVSVIPPEDSILLLPPSSFPQSVEFTGRFRSFEPEIRLRKCFYHGSCVSASQSGTREFVPACRETLSCFQRTGRHHEAAHGTGGRRNCRISRACPSCLHVPRRVASCAHLFSPFPNACPGDHALLQPAARRPPTRRARACTNLAMCPAV